MKIVESPVRRHKLAMRDDRLQVIEDLLREVVAKQDILLGHVLKLGRKVDAIPSEMKSNYVAIDGVFQEILSIIRIQACQAILSVVPDQIQTQEPLDHHS